MNESQDSDTNDSMLDSLKDVGSRSMWARLFHGLLLPLRAARFLIREPKLWPLVVIPAIINIALFAGSAYLLVSYAPTIVDWVWIEPVVDAWYDWLLKAAWYLLVAIVSVLTVLASYIFILLIGGIIASPFNDALSSRVEARLIDADSPPERDENLVWGIIRSIGSSLFILGSYCVVMAPILLLNLVPGVGQVAATFLGTGVSSMFLTMEFIDPPLDRRGSGLRQKFEAIEGNRDIALGFGFGTSLFLWIPFMNLLTIPIAVVGGTALGIALDDWERERR